MDLVKFFLKNILSETFSKYFVLNSLIKSKSFKPVVINKSNFSDMVFIKMQILKPPNIT